MADFSSTRGILNKRPQISFVEPAPVAGLQKPVEQIEPEVTKTQVNNLISNFKDLEKLTDLGLQRIANRGDMKVCLDPAIDAVTIQSLRRHFGTNDLCITHKQYVACLEEVAKAGAGAAPFVDQAAVAQETDRFKTNISGYSKTPGALRPELQFDSPIKPIDHDNFQSASIKQLFSMMTPLISGLSEYQIMQHLFSYPAHFNPPSA